MRVISINVARPMIVTANGQRVKTSIFKRPVPGPVMVRTHNLEGDEQSDLRVHGGPDKAIYAYSWQNVEHWRKYLRRDDLGPGTFGENLTLDGLADDEVAIGDELEIGSARFVVTQPRLPCFKLGIALDLPEFPKVFHRSGRNGFYLRVLKEGLIRAGDEIRMFPPSGQARMTIAEFVRLSSSRHPEPAFVERILKLDALPQSWKDSMMEKARRMGTRP
jgi:MOSC domain-containing protein YiiM